MIDINSKIAVGFDKVVLVPTRPGILNSRDEADTSIEFLGHRFKLPVIPSNMKTVINFELAEWLGLNGYLYVTHRFLDYSLLIDWIDKVQDYKMPISISLGVKGIDRDLVNHLVENKLRCDFIWLDCAHGWAEYMRSMISYIKNSGLNCKVIAGNTWGNVDSILALEKWGADAIKSGLSYGQGCITFLKTSVASPMFTAGLEASSVASVPLIADGSCRNNGHFAVSIRAGYDITMAGSMFAACKDSPAEDVYVGGQHKKLYFGSASATNKGHKKNVEGREVLLDSNEMTLAEKLEEIRQDLSSAISYSGGSKVEDIRNMDYRIVI